MDFKGKKSLLARINDRKPGRTEWIILIIILLVPFVTECFYDFLATYTHGYALLRATTRGEFFSFYESAKEFTLENGYDGTVKEMWGAVYPLTIYIIFAIWSVPVAILRKLFEIGLYDVGVIVWYKLLLCIASAGTIWKMNSILKRADICEEIRRTVSFLFASSLFFTMPIFFMSGYDIFLVFFMFWGLDEYIKDSHAYKWVAVFGLAITFKSFALFVFIPLLLLREKRILACIWKLLLSLIPLAICYGLFIGSDRFLTASSDFLPGFVQKVFDKTIPGGNAPIPIFITGWIALCIWAYMQNVESEARDLAVYSAWMGSVAYGLLTSFVYCHPQWIVILVPFIALILGLNWGKIKINMILELVGTVTLSFYYILHFAWVYCYQGSLSFVALRGLGIQKNEEISLASLFHNTFSFTFDPAIFGVFVIAMIALAFINYPKKSNKECQNELLSHMDYGLIIVRLLVIPALWIADLFINLS